MLKNKLLPISLLLGCGLLPAAHAADEDLIDKRWYIAPFGTFVHTGGDRKADDGWGGGMGFGKMLDRHFNIELDGFYQGYNGQNGPWSMSGGTADVQYYFFRDTFSPYAVFGVGGMDTCLGGKCGAGFIGEAGVGFTVDILDNLMFRSDVRYRYNNNLNANLQPGTNEFNDMVVNVGFVIPFGEKPKAAPMKVETSQPILTRPAPTPPPADPCHGRHFKSSKVDANGCPVIVLMGENFKYDSSVLLPTAKEILDNLAKDLIADPQKNEIEARGYASSEGKKSYNMKLSERRALAVVEYLKSKGVTNKLIAKGFGIADPIADNRTEEGRAQNRRVELIWIEN
ncbi:MAG: OmpA family protein [Methylomonas sp.]|jgi:OOP family OmpA-OmpF porin